MDIHDVVEVNKVLISEQDKGLEKIKESNRSQTEKDIDSMRLILYTTGLMSVMKKRFVKKRIRQRRKKY